jgi:hypothetical protein
VVDERDAEAPVGSPGDALESAGGETAEEA